MIIARDLKDINVKYILNIITFKSFEFESEPQIDYLFL